MTLYAGAVVNSAFSRMDREIRDPSDWPCVKCQNPLPAPLPHIQSAEAFVIAAVPYEPRTWNGPARPKSFMESVYVHESAALANTVISALVAFCREILHVGRQPVCKDLREPASDIDASQVFRYCPVVDRTEGNPLNPISLVTSRLSS